MTAPGAQPEPADADARPGGLGGAAGVPSGGGRLPFVLVFLMLVGISYGVLQRNGADKEALHFEQQSAVLRAAYEAAISTYRLATDLYRREVLERPEVLDLVARAGTATAAEKENLRERLHRLLQSSYETLWAHRLRQLHFHLADGESLFRFHQPDRAGDMLFDFRPSVRIANTEHRMVVGFEVGRVSDGFRFVYPLARAGHHIGSVEASISFQPVRAAMAEIDASREYVFLVHRPLLRQRLYKEFAARYVPSDLHEDFFLEAALPGSRGGDAVPPAAVEAINRLLGGREEVRFGMMQGREFTLGVHLPRLGHFAVSFLPVPEVTDALGGYIVAYRPDPFMASVARGNLVELAVLSLLLAASIWLLWRWRSSVASLADSEARQRVETEMKALRERAEQQERARIARDLHDGIGQSLQAAKLNLKLLQAGMQRGGAADAQLVGQLIEDLQGVSADLSDIVVALRPAPLASMPLDRAIRWLCEGLRKRQGVRIEVTTDGDFAGLDQDVGQAVFRICQEALANIVRHSGAGAARVLLRRDAGGIHFSVADDGCGGALSAPTPAGRGAGLGIMRERVETVGGRLSVHSPAGEGTTITVEVPL